MTQAKRAPEAPSLSGEIAGQPLAVLLAGAATRGATGTFSFRHEDRHDRVTMRDGRIAVVRTSTPVAYLGTILYEQAIIDSATVNQTLLDVARDQRLHGAVLVERGVVTPAQIEAALVEQTLRRVYHLFSLPDEARWTFEEAVDDLHEARDADRPTVDPWQAIWRGLREHPPTRHVTQLMTELESGLRLRRTALGPVGHALTAEERAFCELLAQPMTIPELVASSPFAAERTLQLVYFLVLGRCVVRRQARPRSPVELGCEGVRERARRIAEEDPYRVLGLAPGSTAEAARAAYFRLARVWQPERIPRALDDVRGECAHVLLLIGQAHRALTDVRVRGKAPIVRGASRAVAPSGSHVLPTMSEVDAALARRDLESASALASVLSSSGGNGPAARAVIVWCQTRAGSGPPELLDPALRALQWILAGDPECSRAIFYRGQILKRLGRTESAVRDFQRVKRLDPRHVEAEREVRLHEALVSRGPAAIDRTGERRHESTSSPPAILRETFGSHGDAPNHADSATSLRSSFRRLIGHVAGR